jgi:hypothetical protein
MVAEGFDSFIDPAVEPNEVSSHSKRQPIQIDSGFHSSFQLSMPSTGTSWPHRLRHPPSAVGGGNSPEARIKTL